MSEPFLGEIRLVAFSFPPQGWAACDGQLLPINQNQALFAILGTTYGGNGTTTFALPDLRGRVPLHAGGPFAPGSSGGEESQALTVAALPPHTHAAVASPSPASQTSPVGNTWAASGEPAYAATPDSSLAPQAIATAGEGRGHENRQPLLVVNAIIAVRGLFPSRG